MKVKHDDTYMAIAELIAKNSYAKRNKVGAIVVRDGAIISNGFNGTPSGFPNYCEDENGNTFPWVLHAESNALMKIAHSTYSSEGATLFCTLAPCIECAKLIIQSGIKRVVYKDLYRSEDGLNLLKKTDIILYHYEK